MDFSILITYVFSWIFCLFFVCFFFSISTLWLFSLIFLFFFQFSKLFFSFQFSEFLTFFIILFSSFWFHRIFLHFILRIQANILTIQNHKRKKRGRKVFPRKIDIFINSKIDITLHLLLQGREIVENSLYSANILWEEEEPPRIDFYFSPIIPLISSARSVCLPLLWCATHCGEPQFSVQKFIFISNFKD